MVCVIQVYQVFICQLFQISDVISALIVKNIQAVKCPALHCYQQEELNSLQYLQMVAYSHSPLGQQQLSHLQTEKVLPLHR